MIRSFQCQWVEDLYHGVDSVVSKAMSYELQRKIQRLLDHLNVVASLEEVKIPGIDNFFKLPGGAWGIGLEGGWYIHFKWFHGDVYNLDLIRS